MSILIACVFYEQFLRIDCDYDNSNTFLIKSILPKSS